LGRELVWQKSVADDGVVVGQRTSRIDHGFAGWRAEEFVYRFGGQAEAAQEERGGASVIALVMKGLELGRRLGLARPGCIVGIAVAAVRRIRENELRDVQSGGSCAQCERRTGGVAVDQCRLAGLAMSAATSSSSRSTEYGWVSPLCPRPRRS